jgi:hypothetical protein
MRSTRASAAWAGIAMATSFLSVTIIGTQPHNAATRAIAQSGAMATTMPVNAFGSDNAPKRVDVAESNTTASKPADLLNPT